MRDGLLRWVVPAALACALLVAAPASAQASFRVATYSVPVTTPDTAGAPVTLDTDVYLPDGAPPTGGFPFLEIFHGGGSTKDNPYDAGHARDFANDGYVVLMYSARGHGNSGGQTTIAGPPEIRDLFDVTAWALGIGGRTLPPHPSFHIDASRIALSGYSQGGLHANLGQVWAGDRSVDPYGISFRAIEPGNTPDLTFQALVPNSVVKLSFGLGLIETYAVGSQERVSPEVDRWIATGAADDPQLYGSGDLCDDSGHDAATSTMQADLAWRSVGCHPERMGLPWLWAQAFDDNLFPPQMATSMWSRAPGREQHRLYLSMGGHAAPSADQAVEADKLAQQMRFLDAAEKGGPLPGPNVVYWMRDPAVEVPSDSYAYPPGAWYRETAGEWPPAKVAPVPFSLGSDGNATPGTAKPGSVQLSPVAEDERNDPVFVAAVASTPLGTSPASAVPPTNLPGSVAAFRTAPFRTERELSGSPVASLAWTPSSADSQVVLEVFDEAPSGKLTFFGRGVQGIRGGQAGVERRVSVQANAFSIRIPAGHRIVAWVMAGDQFFYKPYPGSTGGSLRTGDASTLTVPLTR